MDIVITYVNGNDPAWQRDYEKHTNIPAMTKRYRDWGTLKYLLRGIEYRMPFIRRVHLVVSHPTQVPEWANREHLHVVLHSDIIPAEYLPTFNSTAIEMFLHRIPGLDEEFLYFNDDFFPVGKCSPTDFFRNGKSVIGYSRHLFACAQYKKHCRNSDRLARLALGMRPSLAFIRPQHICSPMFRSECEEVFSKVEPQILASLSRLREDYNVNQYLFLDYLYHKGKAIPQRISNRHFSVAVAGAEKISAFLHHPTRALCCINDVHLGEAKFTSMRDAILAAFQDIFPNKSRFEL